jgi:hypothetical protein
MKSDITEKEVKEFKNLLDYFQKFTTGGINSTEEKFLLQMLDHSIRFYTYLVYEGVFDRIERVTINKRIFGSNKRIKNISFLKYPPAHVVKKYGRCNLPYQSVFYGTFAWMIAINEMRPDYGDLITKTIWVNKKNIPLKYFPIFLNQPDGNFINPRTMKYADDFLNHVAMMFQENARELVLGLSQFISDSFAKRVETENHRDYLFSAYFSNKILNNFERGQIDALLYPSVKERLSFENIAIKPSAFDKVYELSEVRESIVVQVPNHRVKGYFMEVIGECKSFDYSTGDLLWENATTRFNPSEFENKKRMFNLDLD